MLNPKTCNTNFQTQDQQTVVLKKGDFIYVHRGLWHSAEAMSDESLSFGVSVTCKTNYHLCRKMLEELLLPNLTMDPFLRQNLSMYLTTDLKTHYKKSDVDKLIPLLKTCLIDQVKQLDPNEIYSLANTLNGRTHQLASMNDSFSYPMQFGQTDSKRSMTEFA